MDWDTIVRLMNSFPKSYIYHNGEFIAHQYAKMFSIQSSHKNVMDKTVIFTVEKKKE